MAMLFSLLVCCPENLATFANNLGWDPDDLASTEIYLEWAYLRDLWNGCDDQTVRREAILATLRPSKAEWLSTCTILKFNAFFGASPRPSSRVIQYPGRWSVSGFDGNIGDDDEFLRTCIYKWAFNIKPDLVLQTPGDHVLCIEAKLESGEGTYPTSAAERAIFDRRDLVRLRQREVQRYLVEEILGFDGLFRYLVPRPRPDDDQAISWPDALEGLEPCFDSEFVSRWLRRMRGD